MALITIFFKLIGSYSGGSTLGADSGKVDVKYAISVSNPYGYATLSTVSRFSDGEVKFKMEIPDTQKDYSIYFEVIYGSDKVKVGPLNIKTLSEKSWNDKNPHVIILKK